MKISVEISDKEMEDILLFTNEKRKGPAIRKLALDALMLRKRRALGKGIVLGEWGANLPDLNVLREDRP
ncbi:MAG: hypothetical protein ACE5JX_12450 [Acidobacteriota bacterium]